MYMIHRDLSNVLILSSSLQSNYASSLPTGKDKVRGIELSSNDFLLSPEPGGPDCGIIGPMKKVISFDLDGTLVNARYGDMVWNHGIPSEYSKIHNMSFDDARALIRRQYESFCDGDLLWYEISYWLERFSITVSPEELLKRYESYIEPAPYAADVLEQLLKNNTLIIASNAARCFVEKELDHTGFGRYFTYIVSATTDFKLIKKEQGFYRRICEYMSVKPSEIVHVGDHAVFDHDVPSSLGIESYYLTDTEDGKTNHDGRQVIGDLRDLLEKL